MIFLSTGGFKDYAFNTCIKYIENGIKNIELSGGKFYEKQLNELMKLKPQANFLIHNYFPPPKNPFVFNLGSLDKQVLKTSINHVKKSIRWAVELNSKYYSFHAGFLIDPKVNELGKRINRRTLYDRKESLNTFIDSVISLSRLAENEGIQLLIENNVLSDNNHKEFNGNPLLMVNSKETNYIMNNTPDNVNLLVDVAHLKVSANSLKFDPIVYLKDCDKWIRAYHFSDNDGLSDSNKTFLPDSWFWKYIKKDLDYYSIEVYSDDIDILKNQIKELKNKILY